MQSRVSPLLTALAFLLLVPVAGTFADDGAAKPADDLHPLFAEKGKAVLTEDFAGSTMGEEWKVAKGDWHVADGVLKGVEKAEDNHPAVVRHEIASHDLIAEFTFRFDAGKSTAFSLNNSKGHVCRVQITPAFMSVQKDKPNAKSDEKPAVLDKQAVEIKPGEWHTVLVEVCGKDMVASLDGKVVAFGSNDAVDVDKTSVAFPVAGDGVSFKQVRIWEATAPKDRDAAWKKLEERHARQPAASAGDKV
jgi:hypothetical protein